MTGSTATTVTPTREVGDASSLPRRPGVGAVKDAAGLRARVHAARMVRVDRDGADVAGADSLVRLASSARRRRCCGTRRRCPSSRRGWRLRADPPPGPGGNACSGPAPVGRHAAPASTLLKSPRAVAAYTVLEVDGSSASAVTRPPSPCRTKPGPGSCAVSDAAAHRASTPTRAARTPSLMEEAF